jgi:hypothetical protein
VQDYVFCKGGHLAAVQVTLADVHVNACKAIFLKTILIFTVVATVARQDSG